MTWSSRGGKSAFAPPMAACHLLKPSATPSWQAAPSGFTECVYNENSDGDDFAAARLAAYHHCASNLQEQVACALGGLNERVLGEIGEFLRTGTKLVQRAWAHDAMPPYVELPTAFVHTCCHSADLPLALRQLQRHMRMGCSPHVAVLHSKECGTLLSATRSLVAQLVAPSAPARISSGCAYDFGVLAGWHADLCAGRVAARSRPWGASGAQSDGVGVKAPSKPERTPLVVIIEDAEHFAADVLNDLIYSCASVRSHDGAPLPLCLVFALSAGVEALQRLLHRSSLILMRGGRFALASTDKSVDAIIGRLLCSTSFPHLSGDAYAFLLEVLHAQHASTTAFVRQLHYLLLHHFRSSPLAFLLPLETVVPPNRGSCAVKAAENALASLIAHLGPAQLRALQALPSVAAALAGTAATPRALDRSLCAQLPKWLAALSRARRRRAAVLGCVQSLLSTAFPGANRTTTSARQLLAEVLAGPVSTAPAVIMGLTKCTERGDMALSAERLRALLLACREQLILAQSAIVEPGLDGSLASLDALLAQPDGALANVEARDAIASAARPGSVLAVASGGRVGEKRAGGAEDVAGGSDGSALITPGPRSTGVAGPAKRRRMALSGASSVGAAAGAAGVALGAAGGGDDVEKSAPDGGAEFARRVAGWLLELIEEHGDTLSKMPLHELCMCDPTSDPRLEETFCDVPQRKIEEQLLALAAAARNPTGSAPRLPPPAPTARSAPTAPYPAPIPPVAPAAPLAPAPAESMEPGPLDGAAEAEVEAEKEAVEEAVEEEAAVEEAVEEEEADVDGGDMDTEGGGGEAAVEEKEADMSASAMVEWQPPTVLVTDLPIGTAVMAKDRGQWYDAKVVETREGEVRIHFNGYKKTPTNFRWLPLASEMLQLPNWATGAVPVTPAPPPPPRMEFEEPSLPALMWNGAPTENQVDEASSAEGAAENVSEPVDVHAGSKVKVEWRGHYYPAKVIETDEEAGSAFVHFDGFKKRYDEWIKLDGNRIKIPTPHRSPRGHASSAAADAAQAASSPTKEVKVDAAEVDVAAAVAKAAAAAVAKAAAKEEAAAAAAAAAEEELESRVLPEVGTACKAMDRGHWYPAKVVGTRDGEVKIHYAGFKSRWDIWLPLKSNQLKLPIPRRKKHKAAEAMEAEAEAEKEQAEEEEADAMQVEVEAMEERVAEVVEEEGEGEEKAAVGSPASPLRVDAGDHIKVMDRGEWWSAKVMRTDEESGMAYVHFLGWSKRHDCWIELQGSHVRMPTPTRSKQQLADTQAAEEPAARAVARAAAAAMEAAAEQVEEEMEEAAEVAAAGLEEPTEAESVEETDAAAEGAKSMAITLFDEAQAEAEAAAAAAREAREMPEEGTNVRAMDRGHWYDAKVVETREGEVRIHFNGYKKTPTNFRWLPLASKMLELPKPRRKAQKKPAAPPSPAEEAAAEEAAAEAAEEEARELSPRSPVSVQVGAAVRALEGGKWWAAKVVDVDEGMALLHYQGWKARFDEWVALDRGLVKLPSPTRSPRMHASSIAADAAIAMQDETGTEEQAADDEALEEAAEEAEAAEEEAVAPEVPAAAAVAEEELEPPEMPEVGAACKAMDRGRWYDAKVVDTREGEVRIHFNGFKKTPTNFRWLPLTSSLLKLPKKPKKRARAPKPPPAAGFSCGDEVADAPADAPVVMEEEEAEGGVEDADEVHPPISVIVNQIIQVAQCGTWYRSKVVQVNEVRSFLLPCECTAASTSSAHRLFSPVSAFAMFTRSGRTTPSSTTWDGTFDTASGSLLRPVECDSPHRRRAHRVITHPPPKRTPPPDAQRAPPPHHPPTTR